MRRRFGVWPQDGTPGATATTSMKHTLYFANGANCSDRIRWAMAYKGISFEGIDIEASDGAAPVGPMGPFCRVPVLVADQQVLTESMAIAEYMEELHPDPPLMPKPLLERARVREVCEGINSSIHPVQNSSVLRAIQPSWTKDTIRQFRSHWIASNLEKLHPLLWRSSSYAVGVQFTLADIFVAVMYRKLVSLGGTPSELPKYAMHWKFLMSNPAIAASCPGEQGAQSSAEQIAAAGG